MLISLSVEEVEEEVEEEEQQEEEEEEEEEEAEELPFDSNASSSVLTRRLHLHFRMSGYRRRQPRQKLSV